MTNWIKKKHCQTLKPFIFGLNNIVLLKLLWAILKQFVESDRILEYGLGQIPVFGIREKFARINHCCSIIFTIANSTCINCIFQILESTVILIKQQKSNLAILYFSFSYLLKNYFHKDHTIISVFFVLLTLSSYKKTYRLQSSLTDGEFAGEQDMVVVFVLLFSFRFLFSSD